MSVLKLRASLLTLLKMLVYSGLIYFVIHLKINSFAVMNDKMGRWKLPAALMSKIEDLSHHPNSAIRSKYRFIALRKHLQGREVLIDQGNHILKGYEHRLYLHALASNVQAVDSSKYCDLIKLDDSGAKDTDSLASLDRLGQVRMRFQNQKICLMLDEKFNFSVHAAKDFVE